MATTEKLARQARDIITSDDESVWLDLPQIMNAVRPALSSFFEVALKDEGVRKLFPRERTAITVLAGEVDLSGLASYITAIVDQVEVFLSGWSYPVRITPGKERIFLGSVTDALYIHAYREGTKLVFGPDTVGAFGGGIINQATGYINAPKVALDPANLPELLEGKFVAFLANYVKEQVLKRP